MEYQLVLQFRGDSLDDYDAMILLEEKLIEAFENIADVDGHDVGSGEVNIFILTTDPKTTFQQIKPVLELRKKLETVIVAYRKIDEEDYTVIWPENYRQEFKVI